MYYEVYIDVMFLVNFMMDVLILFSVKALMKMPGSTKRVIAGGLVGSGLSCLVVILRLPVGITMAVLHMLVSSGMVVCGLKIRSFSEFLKCYILLYFVSVLIGGILGMLKPYVKYTSLYFAVVIGCFTQSARSGSFCAGFRRRNSRFAGSSCIRKEAAVRYAGFGIPEMC